MVQRQLSTWWRKRRQRKAAIKNARWNTALAEEKARYHLAAYRIKSDIEWDIRFMSPLDKTWKDEFVLLVMAIPLLGMFIPGLREMLLAGFQALAVIDPNAPSIFTYGWATIFLATFGKNLAKGFTMPGKFASIVTALSNSKEDIPDVAVEAAQEAASEPPKQPTKETTE